MELAGIPEILEGYGLTGSADLLLRVVALDAEDLFRINGKILACDGVDRTDTALAMGELIPFRHPAAAGAGLRRKLSPGPARHRRHTARSRRGRRYRLCPISTPGSRDMAHAIKAVILRAAGKD